MPSYCLDLSSYNTLARYRGIGNYEVGLAHGLERLRGELAPDERFLSVFSPNEAPHEAPLRPEHHATPLPPPAQQTAHYDRYFARRWLRLYPTLIRNAPNVVHFVEGPQAMISSSYGSVVTCHDLIPLRLPQWYIPRRLWNEPLRRAKDYLRYHLADRLIAVSHATALDLEQLLSIPRQRISVIHQGVDHDLFRPEAPAGERAEQVRRFSLPLRYCLYVGACDYRKQVDLLLRAYRQIFRATGVPLVLVGSWTEAPPPKLRSLLSQAPPGAIRLLGEVDPSDLPGLYRHAELHLLPSIYEGFGLTVLEAMASGCPVVTTRGGALGEAGGEAACYVAPQSASELEDATVSLLTDPVRRERLRDLGLAHARSFTWDRTARETLEVYRRCAGYRSPLSQERS
jgi:glycosyltransferase involved in cell wall biosynthesis